MIEAQQGHDAAVVRCSSCGAPRTEGANRCGFCHSDFTLRDRDLDSVCPACFARVSGKNKYCHHCGTALLSESAKAEATPLRCPVCLSYPQLDSRSRGGVNVLECGSCLGQWMTVESFGFLTQNAESKANEGVGWIASPDHARPGEQDSPSRRKGRYRPCPVCRGLMVQRNFGQKSGVIIDWCRGHGVWFDQDELSRIIGWIQSGAWTRIKAGHAIDTHKARLAVERALSKTRKVVHISDNQGHEYFASTPVDDIADSTVNAMLGLLDAFSD